MCASVCICASTQLKRMCGFKYVSYGEQADAGEQK